MTPLKVPSLVVLAGLISVTASAGCGDDEPAPPGTVLVVGDSLFFQASPRLEREIGDRGWRVEVEAQIGAGIEGGGVDDVDWSQRLDGTVPDLDPEVAVVELGTNGCGPGCTSLPDAIDALLADLSDVPMVLWLTVRTDAPSPENAEEINADLRAATERWDNLELLPFHEWFAGRPELLEDDGVHLSPQGRDVLARHVADAVDRRTGD
ncbi:MAG: SGNH/GDSL hydrolase family protein [Acidimicrobiia bacterium]